MNQYLSHFYNNEGQRIAVKEYMIECLKEITVEKAFAGEEVTGIKDARLMVERFFEKLEEKYGKIERPINNTSR